MELRAIEHAVTHSPSPARSIACVAQPSRPRPPASPLFSVPALRSLHTGGVVTYVHRSEFGADRSTRPGHALLRDRYTSSTAGRGLLSQSKARKRTRSPGWPRCRARSRSMHRVSAPTRRQCTSDVAVLIATSWLHGARAGTREGSSLQADPGPLTTRREPTPKRGCRCSARARAPPQATALLTLSCTL